MIEYVHAMSCDLPQITPCPPSQRAAALDLVLQELPDAARRQMVRSILSDPVEVERNTAGLLVASDLICC